jgi:hypothetical protein
VNGALLEALVIASSTLQDANKLASAADREDEVVS